MKNIFTFVCIYLILCTSSSAQIKVSQNVIIVTLDGMRWQEVFGGADSLLTHDTAASYSTGYVKRKFWANTAGERREKLMPFMWSVIAKDGAILGNRNHGSFVNNANPYWFSYPGYNEIFTGYPDTSINSNDKIPNKNENVLEFLNKQSAFKNKVASFGSWDVFASIFNEKRSGFLVNDGFRDVPGKLNERQKYLNTIQHQMPDLFHGGERLDVATFNIAFEYIKANKPRVLHIGLGDTDEFAHAGLYDYYLDAAQKTDAWIKQLWDYIQSEPQYANKTTLILTTDHGRGSATGGNWKHHGAKIEGASEMWIAAIGPSVQAAGESMKKEQIHQGQVAATIALFTGNTFKTDHPVLPPLKF